MGCGVPFGIRRGLSLGIHFYGDGRGMGPCRKGLWRTIRGSTAQGGGGRGTDLVLR